MSKLATALLAIALVTNSAPSAWAQDEEPTFGPDSGSDPQADDGDDDDDDDVDDEGAAADQPEPKDDGDSSSGTETGPAADATITDATEPSRELFRINGYIQPQFDFRYRPSAFPRDRTNYGASATRTGLIMTGEPLAKWSYTFHVVMSAGLLNNVGSIEVIDRDGDGTPEDVAERRQSNPGIFIERAVVDYRPMDSMRVRLGQMRIPFTIQNQSPNFSLLFPGRSGPNQFFLSGTDLGGLVTYSHPLFQASAGVFNGTGADNTTASVRGLLYALRFDVNPLGDFPFSGVVNRSGPLRVGLGAGLLYFPSEQFEASGFEGINVRDLRASLSARVKVGGLYAQAELLRRQRTDNLSSRPVIATGGYAQGSYYIALKTDVFGLSPIARAGMTVEDQSFEPRTSILTEAGAAFYWHRGSAANDTIKLIVQYFGEQRITEGEDAYGLTTQLQLQF
ncbi:MAG: OprO/OprP family phosphate-selective porin [Deltaproteobacteria bacterium]|nr:OprO/OprP family phosphate-selective porin [Deltaproteobacteria bacterium]